MHLPKSTWLNPAKDRCSEKADRVYIHNTGGRGDRIGQI